MQIKNSVFLVTGGASGLGAATARMAAENGGKVVIADMQAELGEKVQERGVEAREPFALVQIVEADLEAEMHGG